MGPHSLRMVGGFLCLDWGLFIVAGLKLKSFDIPQSGIVGGSVTISCGWEIDESKQLYSAKLFRDERELFRYIPNSRFGPAITTFPEDGLYPHPNKGETFEIESNRFQFQLQNLELRSGGSYHCEVAADAPSFITRLSQKKRLSIMALPKEPKVILSGFPFHARLEDRLEGKGKYLHQFQTLPSDLFPISAYIHALSPCILENGTTFFPTAGRIPLFQLGLKLKSFDIPQSGIVGGSITLSCEWEFGESEKLFSAKLYRHGLEFFRYIPNGRFGPEITTFPQDGVYPDFIQKGETLEIQNNRIQFQLQNLKLNSGGKFHCEVAALPITTPLSQEKRLSIMALPTEPKVILSGFPFHARLEDRLEGNCTFVDSFPPADITFYLNNEEPVNSKDVEVIHYKPNKAGERFRSTSGLKFTVLPQHFRNGAIEIKCEAALFDKRWEAFRIITETEGKNQVSSGNFRILQPLFLLSLVVTVILNLS